MYNYLVPNITNPYLIDYNCYNYCYYSINNPYNISYYQQIPNKDSANSPQLKSPRKLKKRINRRNILPNITRKILSFISNEKLTKSIILGLFPQFEDIDLLKFYKYVEEIKQQLSYYISKKDIIMLWKCKRQKKYLSNQEEQVFRKILRILSNRFLYNDATNWIILSKKMKKSLKNQHIKHVRKMKKMLNEDILKIEIQ